MADIPQQAGRTHWIYGNGEVGCSFDNFGVAETEKEAIDALCLLFDDSEYGLPPRFREVLTQDGAYYFHLELTEGDDGYWGAGVANVTPCNCLTPWDHAEEISPGLSREIERFKDFWDKDLKVMADFSPRMAAAITDLYLYLMDTLTDYFWEGG